MKTRLGICVLVCLALVVGGLLRAADSLALKCPVSGKPVVAGHSATFNGGEVKFCCDNCAALFQEDAPKYTAKANQQMVVSGQLKQSACPLTGRAVAADKTVAFDGLNVGVCCEKCQSKLQTASADEKLLLIFGESSQGFTPAAH